VDKYKVGLTTICVLISLVFFCFSNNFANADDSYGKTNNNTDSFLFEFGQKSVDQKINDFFVELNNWSDNTRNKFIIKPLQELSIYFEEENLLSDSFTEIKLTFSTSLSQFKNKVIEPLHHTSTNPNKVSAQQPLEKNYQQTENIKSVSKAIETVSAADTNNKENSFLQSSNVAAVFPLSQENTVFYGIIVDNTQNLVLQPSVGGVDSVNILELMDEGVRVVYLPSLPAGTNVIGKVEQSGNWAVSTNGLKKDDLSLDANKSLNTNIKNQPTVNAVQSGVWQIDVSDPGFSETIVDVNTGGTQTNDLLVSLAGETLYVANVSSTSLAVNDSGSSITIDGTVTANQGGTWTVGLSTGSNIVGKIYITDGVENVLVDAAGNMMVSLGTAIPAGTNNIGDVDVLTLPNVTIGSALPAGDNNIGNVDIASSIPAGTNAIGKLAPNDGVDIGDTTVNNASDSGVYVRPGTAAIFPVSDNGGSLTVDGTITADAGTGTFYVDNAAGQTVDVAGTVTANLGTIADVATQTTLSALNAKFVTGTDIGDVTINNAAGASAVNIQDGGNAITVDGAVIADAGSGTFYIDNAVGQTVDIVGTVTANLGTIADVATQTTLSALNTKFVTGTDIGDVTINNAADVGVYVRPGTGATWVLAANSGVDIGDVDVASITAGSNLIGKVKLQDKSGNEVDWADLGNEALKVSVVSGGGSGTQYAEGAVAATVTGTAVMWKDAGNTIRTVTAANPLPIGDAGGAITVDGTVTANLGTIADVATQTTLSALNAKFVTGTDIGDVTINNAAGASAVNIQDGGNAITVDGTVTANLGTIADVATQTTLSALNTKFVTGTDIGDVTINNAAGASAVNIQDGGNAITIDGTITADAGSGTFYVDNAVGQSVDVAGTVTANLGTIADVATQTTLSALNTKFITGTDIGDVTINNAAGASAVNIQDGGNAITVDGTVTADAGTGTFYVDNAVGQTVDVAGTVTANLGTIADVATQTTLSALNTKFVTGTDIGDVTINNAAGASAVNIQDGGNAITVDGTVTADAGTGTFYVDNAVGQTVDVAGTVTANLGTIADVATQTTLSALNTKFVTGTDIGDVTINNAAGASAVNIQDGGNAITVDGTVTANLGTIADVATQTTLSALNAKFVTGTDIGDVDILSIIPGVGATNLGKAVDAAAGGTDTGVASLAMRDDALGGITPIAGDYNTLLVDANGALWTHDNVLGVAVSGNELQVDIVGALPAGTNGIGKLTANSGVDIGDVDVASIATGANTIGKIYITDGTNDIEVAVEGSAAKTKGIQTLGRYDSTYPTAVDDGDATVPYTDAYGVQAVSGYQPRSASANNSQTGGAFNNTEIIATPGAGLSLYITDITVSSSSAQTITFVRNTAGAVNVIGPLYFAANGGAVLNFTNPIKITANQNFGWTGSVGANTSATVNYYIAP